MKLFLTFLIFALLQFLLSAAVFAQSGQISGKLKDEHGLPVGYATVNLVSVKDSAVIQATLSGDAGNYNLKRVPEGRYIIKATAVGYMQVHSAGFVVNIDTAVFCVPDLEMATSRKTLGVVSISGSKPVVEETPGKTVINVAGSILSAGNSAMDILARAPGISIDKDDNISLKGKMGVTVMINDKVTYLTPSQLATLLNATDGSTIQSIEIITNPSAKYDAAGNSGIINIKLKKAKQHGTNGSLTAGAGYSNYGKDNETLTLNHREGKLNIFSSFSHNDNKREQLLQIRRVIADTSFFDQYSGLHHITHNNTYRLGADYDLSAANTLGFVVNGYFNTGNDDADGRTAIGKDFNSADSSLRTVSTTQQTLNNFSANLNDTWKIDSAGQQLSVDLDYARFTNTSNTNYTTNFFLANGSEQHPVSFLGTQSPSVIDVHTVKLDYSKLLSKKITLESGVKASDVKTDNDLEQAYIPGSAYSSSNHFIYHEKINAAYANFNAVYGGLSVKAGLRAEYTSSTAAADSSGVSQINSRHYLDLFPSLMISDNFSSSNEISFSYNRRIDRPQYDKLNPFIFVLDPYTYIKGNPFLMPQYTNNFEVSYSWKKQLTITLGYSKTKDVIVEVPGTDPQTKIAFITEENLQVQNSYNVNIFTPYTFTKWWEGNVNVTGFYLGFKSTDLEGSDLDRGKFVVQAKTTQLFSLFKNYKAELTTSYQSAMDYSLYYLKPQYSTDAGVSHTFADKKANIKLSMSDIFNTLRADANSLYQDNNIDIRQKRESRIIRLTLTYNFGTNGFRSRLHSSGAEDERGRVKSN